MADGLFFKGRTNEEGTNTLTAVASYHDQYQEGNMMFYIRVEPFGVGVSFNATTNPPTQPTQTAKLPDPTNPNAPFITDTSNMDVSKENTPLDMATVTLTPDKLLIETFKDQGQPLSSHTVEL